MKKRQIRIALFVPITCVFFWLAFRLMIGAANILMGYGLDDLPVSPRYIATEFGGGSSAIALMHRTAEAGLFEDEWPNALLRIHQRINLNREPYLSELRRTFCSEKTDDMGRFYLYKAYLAITGAPRSETDRFSSTYVVRSIRKHGEGPVVLDILPERKSPRECEKSLRARRRQ